MITLNWTVGMCMNIKTASCCRWQETRLSVGCIEVWPVFSSGAGEKLPYRFNWTLMTDHRQGKDICLQCLYHIFQTPVSSRSSLRNMLRKSHSVPHWPWSIMTGCQYPCSTNIIILWIWGEMGSGREQQEYRTNEREMKGSPRKWQDRKQLWERGSEIQSLDK